MSHGQIWHVDRIAYFKPVKSNRNIRLSTLVITNTPKRQVLELIRLLKLRCSPALGEHITRRLQFTCFDVGDLSYLVISGLSEGKSHSEVLPFKFRDSILMPTLDQYGFEIAESPVWVDIPVTKI